MQMTFLEESIKLASYYLTDQVFQKEVYMKLKLSYRMHTHLFYHQSWIKAASVEVLSSSRIIVYKNSKGIMELNLEGEGGEKWKY